jgi:hypothetical protein
LRPLIQLRLLLLKWGLIFLISAWSYWRDKFLGIVCLNFKMTWMKMLFRCVNINHIDLAYQNVGNRLLKERLMNMLWIILKTFLTWKLPRVTCLRLQQHVNGSI